MAKQQTRAGQKTSRKHEKEKKRGSTLVANPIGLMAGAKSTPQNQTQRLLE